MSTIPLPALVHSHLLKPILVTSGVVVAFLAGVPPVLAASVGAAILLKWWQHLGSTLFVVFFFPVALSAFCGGLLWPLLAYAFMGNILRRLIVKAHGRLLACRYLRAIELHFQSGYRRVA